MDEGHGQGTWKKDMDKGQGNAALLPCHYGPLVGLACFDCDLQYAFPVCPPLHNACVCFIFSPHVVQRHVRDNHTMSGAVRGSRSSRVYTSSLKTYIRVV